MDNDQRISLILNELDGIVPLSNIVFNFEKVFITATERKQVKLDIENLKRRHEQYRIEFGLLLQEDERLKSLITPKEKFEYSWETMGKEQKIRKNKEKMDILEQNYTANWYELKRLEQIIIDNNTPTHLINF